MGLSVISAASEVTADRSRATVVVESDHPGPPFTQAFEELTGTGAREAAQAWAAAQGVAPAHINGNVQGPYPVNAKGVPLDQVKDPKGQPLPPRHEDMRPASYRVDVPVCRPLR
jgi:hypothetical protein